MIQTSESESGQSQRRLAYKIKEAADLLGLSYNGVYRLLQRGVLKGNRSLRHVLIPATELDRFLKSNLQ